MTVILGFLVFTRRRHILTTARDSADREGGGKPSALCGLFLQEACEEPDQSRERRACPDTRSGYSDVDRLFHVFRHPRPAYEGPIWVKCVAGARCTMEKTLMMLDMECVFQARDAGIADCLTSSNAVCTVHAGNPAVAGQPTWPI